MRTLTFLQPQRLTFGSGCLHEAIDYLNQRAFARIHIVASPSQEKLASALADALTATAVTLDTTITAEPTITVFHLALTRAREANADCIVGLGGGSPLDVGKLVAAFTHNRTQTIEDTFGIGLLRERACHLVCLPTTSGTGSEVSPNAILLDEAAQLKKGVISPFLVPDATFIDPELTHSLPAFTTAATGLDALTHCIEAYTNKFAHPLVDIYALEGVRLAARYLARAVHDGSDAEAREGMSRASLYGGLCLGPVNTAAVHALAYPLGGEFHVAHGLSNAVLLPAVFRFNAVASPERHAEVAVALGAASANTPLETAMRGAEQLEQLAAACGIEIDLTKLGIARDAVPRMAASAMTVQRLLKNNPRDITQADAERLYLSCFHTPANA